MKLVEFFHRVEQPYHDVTQDQSRAQRKDARKTRLTLRKINQLRRMDDMRKIEHDRNVSKLKNIYGTQPGTAGEMTI